MFPLICEFGITSDQVCETETTVFITEIFLICSMESLEMLNLSQNNLSGSILSNFEEMHGLSLVYASPTLNYRAQFQLTDTHLASVWTNLTLPLPDMFQNLLIAIILIQKAMELLTLINYELHPNLVA